MANPLPQQPIDETGEPPLKDWSRLQRDVATTLWCSFLVSAAATMLFFAFVDPAAISFATTPPLEVSRMTGYAIGFFFFWAATVAASALTIFMVRSRQHHPQAPPH